MASVTQSTLSMCNFSYTHTTCVISLYISHYSPLTLSIVGYGHIYPATNTGRAITIVYAIIGIPMFLILLADFGKLFTRGIKFMWAYVRRLYYTGSLRKVRKQAQVQVGVVFQFTYLISLIKTSKQPTIIINRFCLFVIYRRR